MTTVRQLYLALNCVRKKEEEIVGNKKLKFWIHDHKTWSPKTLWMQFFMTFFLKDVWDLSVLYFGICSQRKWVLIINYKLNFAWLQWSLAWRKVKGIKGFKFSKLDVYVILLNFWSVNSGINVSFKRSRMGPK